MKKVMIILVTAMTVMSCNKEDVNKKDCTCGTVIDEWTNSVQSTFKEVENDCSGNVYKDYNVEGKKVGDEACLGFEW